MVPWLTAEGGYEFKFEDVGKAVGFVYLICRDDGKKYIGAKLFTRSKIVRHKGKRPRRTRVESDWQNYWGSNTQLQDDVVELGEERFTRTILHLAYNKSELNYLELMEQMNRKVLLRPKEYYNAFIGRRIARVGLGRLLESSS